MPFLQSTETFQLVEEARVPDTKEAPGRDFWRGVGLNRAGGSGMTGQNVESEMRSAQVLLGNQGDTGPANGQVPLPNLGGVAQNRGTGATE